MTASQSNDPPSSLGSITLLDYGAGNVRSIRNAIQHLNYTIHDVNTSDDINNAKALLFPGVGSFATCIQQLQRLNYTDALQRFLISSTAPFFGICLGMQVLFQDSVEGSRLTLDGEKAATRISGLGVLSGHVELIAAHPLPVPHIGWNTIHIQRTSQCQAERSQSLCDLFTGLEHFRFYFVHSYCAPVIASHSLTSTTYGSQVFTSSVQQQQIVACQFHPEKSGEAGLEVLRRFLQYANEGHFDIRPIASIAPSLSSSSTTQPLSGLCKRLIACLDVRENEYGDLVVTKGESYDVRDKSTTHVRNLGKPVSTAHKYYEQHADEITLLNITAYRGETLNDLPLKAVLIETSRHVFVPLCIGGGIRSYTDQQGQHHSALDVAAEYFRSGADKVSIGSDAVYAAEEYWKRGGKADGTTSIEAISRVYGVQACVVSVDPRRVYVDSPAGTRHHVIETSKPNSKGQRYCWFECTVKGGRESRDLDVIELCVACIAFGCGEILLNSMDADGQKQGYDIELMRHVTQHPQIVVPVIASSGAGCVEHFAEVFDKTDVSAALAAGIFHRSELSIQEVKEHCQSKGIPMRL